MPTAPSRESSSFWARARALAEDTPATRNRYADLLRALSIVVVVAGHWLLNAAYVREGELLITNLFTVAPWTQWLTWLFQVIPVFFLVGGYSNAASWRSAERAGHGFGLWAAARLRRLVAPVVPLVVLWVLISVCARLLDVDPQSLEVGSRLAFIPTWFLSVYVMVVLVAPLTYRAFRRLGAASFHLLALGAVLVDLAAFGADLPWLRWANYAFVWLAVHQLGYLWHEFGSPGPMRSLAMAAVGLALLIALIAVFSYPVSMITVPGEEISNSRPPTFALVALAMLQGGLLLAVEAPARRWLERTAPWTATIVVNGSIMTVFLWHSTVMVGVVALAYLLGGVGLGAEPGAPLWWASRVLWLAALASVLSLFVMALGRFERRARGDAAAFLPAWRAIAGSMALSYGLAGLALGGVAAENLLGIRAATVTITLIGAALVLLEPRRRSS